MRTNLKKSLSGFLAAAILLTSAAINVNAAEATDEWGYVEDFSSYQPGVTEIGKEYEPVYIRNAETGLVNGNMSAVKKGETIDLTINKIPKERFEIHADLKVDEGLTDAYVQGHAWGNENQHAYLPKLKYDSVDQSKTWIYKLDDPSAISAGETYDTGEKDADGNAITAELTNDLLNRLVINFKVSSMDNIKIYLDGEELLMNWSYSENFDNMADGTAPSSGYGNIIYENAKIENHKLVDNGSGMTMKIFAKAEEKVVVKMDIAKAGAESSNFQYYFDVFDNSSMSSDSYARFKDYSTQEGSVEVIADMEKVRGKGFYLLTLKEAAVDNIKIYIDGKKLYSNPDPTFSADFSNYAVEEKISNKYVTSDYAVKKNEQTGKNCLDLSTTSYEGTIVFTMPTEFLAFELDIPKSDSFIHLDYINADGTSVRKVIYNQPAKNGDATYRYSVRMSDDPDAAKYTQIRIISKYKISAVRVWYDYQPAKAWDYTSYNYMSDFESNNDETVPQAEWVEFTSPVKRENNNTYICPTAPNGNNIIKLKHIAQNSTIVTFDAKPGVNRFENSNPCAEQLQAWGYMADGSANYIKQIYDGIFDDSLTDDKWQSFVFCFDAVNKKINIYRDGAAIKNITMENYNADWSYINLNFLNMDIDNLMVSVDPDKGYAGTFMTDSNGTRINNITSGMNVIGKAYSINYVRKAMPAELIMALYEKAADGTPKLVKCEKTSIEAKNGSFVSGNEFNVGTLENGKEYYVKQFIWDNTDDMNPLTLPQMTAK